MPELPEVETLRRGLSKLIIGKTVAKLSFDTPKSFPNAPEDVNSHLLGASVIDVTRRAKVLLVGLDSKYSLVIHLKMTGQLVFRSSTKDWGAGHPSDSLVNKLPDRSTRVTFEFSDGSKLFFNDQRKFGWVRLLPNPEIPNIDFFKRVGPEPLAVDFGPKDFRLRIRRRKDTTIKAALLDQTVIAGVGNIYADESLWGAKIHPSKRVRELSDRKLNTLFNQLQLILKLAIEQGGSTDRNYVNAEGKRGNYLNFARVFRREGKACPRCKTLVVKLRVAGRGTHICPRCQKEPV